MYLLATEGATSKAKKAFAKAVKSNKHVLEIFVGAMAVEEDDTHYYSPGNADKAQFYFSNSIDLWVEDKNVIDNLDKLLDKLT